MTYIYIFEDPKGVSLQEILLKGQGKLLNVQEILLKGQDKLLIVQEKIKSDIWNHKDHNNRYFLVQRTSW